MVTRGGGRRFRPPPRHQSRTIAQPELPQEAG
jgi:hypothetical protein